MDRDTRDGIDHLLNEFIKELLKSDRQKSVEIDGEVINQLLIILDDNRQTEKKFNDWAKLNALAWIHQYIKCVFD